MDMSKDMTGKSSVLLVDDHPIVRDGLHQMIERDPGLWVCGEAGSAEETLEMMKTLQPDLLTVDVFLDGMNGIELTKMLTERYPGIRILILSMHDENLYAERALRAGAQGYVMKQQSSRVILSAIHEVLAGRQYVSDGLKNILDSSKRVVGDAVPPAQDIAGLLSDREMSIFRAFGEGLDRTGVAEKLNISIKTVETHRSNIKNKLHIGRSGDLTEVAKSWFADHAS